MTKFRKDQIVFIPYKKEEKWYVAKVKLISKLKLDKEKIERYYIYLNDEGINERIGEKHISLSAEAIWDRLYKKHPKQIQPLYNKTGSDYLYLDFTKIG